MKNLHIGEFSFPLPESMNEMTTDQLMFIGVGCYGYAHSEVKVKMLFYCLGAHAKRMKNPGYFRVKIDKNTFALTAEDVTNASTAFDYLYTEPDENDRVFFDNRLTVNHYPTIKIRNVHYYSPMNALEDMVYNQYIYLQTYDVMQKISHKLYTPGLVACSGEIRRTLTHMS